MYLTIKQQVKNLNKNEYLTLRELSHIAKNLTNEALYNIRQFYFREGKILSYNENYKILKNSKNYKLLNSNMAQQIIKEVDGSFKSFLELLKLSKKGEYKESVRMPKYLKNDDFATLIIGFIRIKNNKLKIPYSYKFRENHNYIEIKIPAILENKSIKEIRIVPKAKARFFEIQYIYEVVETQMKLDKNKALAIDFGINNLATCVTSDADSFIIDGKRLKSINQWYNKENSRLESIRVNQGYINKTNRQNKNTLKRNNRVNDYISKAAKLILNYCIDNKIGCIVCGYNLNFQKKNNIGKINNQNFYNIPFGKLYKKIKYLARLNGIKFILQEESYTSKASFLDRDFIPQLDNINSTKAEFSGKRIKRGLYQTKYGKIINADVNGALNILAKSKVVSLDRLYCRGELKTPLRIRIN